MTRPVPPVGGTSSVDVPAQLLARAEDRLGGIARALRTRYPKQRVGARYGHPPIRNDGGRFTARSD